MSKWKNAFKKIAHQAESKLDEFHDRMTYRLGLLDKVHTVIYHGYASDKEAYISGRVLEDRNVKAPSDQASKWTNLLDAYKRLESNEIADALLSVTFGGVAQQIKSDKEGYFRIKFLLDRPLPFIDNGHEVHAEILDFPAGALVNSEGDTGKVFAASPQAAFGVISDIDDTIMQTGATNLLKMAWATFTQNARTRIAFKGVSAFYQALAKGKSATPTQPFFYVSSSPWNLYDLLKDFIEVNDIPTGPLFLRDYGLDDSKFVTGTHGKHKRTAIEQILKTYPHLKFILIGDSGQEDAFIYYHIAQDFPDRISTIYIRDAKVPEQADKVMETIHKANSEGIDMVLVQDSLIAARHAVSKGLISMECLSEIEDEILEEDHNDKEIDRLFAENP